MMTSSGGKIPKMKATLSKEELIENLTDKIQELSWEVFFYDELIRHIQQPSTTKCCVCGEEIEDNGASLLAHERTCPIQD